MPNIYGAKNYHDRGFAATRNDKHRWREVRRDTAVTEMFGPQNKELSLPVWQGALAMLAERGLPVVCLPDMEGQGFLNTLDFLDFAVGVDSPSLVDVAEAA